MVVLCKWQRFGSLIHISTCEITEESKHKEERTDSRLCALSFSVSSTTYFVKSSRQRRRPDGDVGSQ